MAAQIEAACHVGALAPSAYGVGVYKLCTSRECNSAATLPDPVKVYQKGNTPNELDLSEDTIFEVTRFGRTVYLLNMESKVTIGSGPGAKTIRNPPHFLPLIGERFGQWGDQFSHEQDWLAEDGTMDEIDALIEPTSGIP